MLPSFQTKHVARLGLAALALALEVATPLASTSFAQTSPAAGVPTTRAAVGCNDAGPPDYPISGGWFYTEEARGCLVGMGPARKPGYMVVDDDQGAFWTEFRRNGGVEVLGYPVSQRFHYPATNDSGYWYQAFERGILQWRPEAGRAELANVFEQFSENGLDSDLEALGIPNASSADAASSFAADAERRMSWLSEPRFLARYFFDPVAPHSSDPDRLGQTTFATQEQAWGFFGLPQSLPAQLALRGSNRVSLYPLMHTFVAQRFQKGGMQLFLQEASESFANPGWAGTPGFLMDPTIVPGDGRKGCVALTAVGLLARTIGADKIIPSTAIQPVPASPNPFVDSFVPPVTTNQMLVSFQLTGSGFAANEPINVVLVDARPNPMGSTLPSVSANVTAYRDGSWDQIMTARVGVFQITATGTISGNRYDGILDLTVASANYVAALTRSTCKDVGVPIGA
jgi:hypothetical protein